MRVEAPSIAPANGSGNETELTQSVKVEEFPTPDRRHAWRKLAGYLIRDTLTDMFKKRQDVIIVDACSSLPVFERMTETTLSTMALRRAERSFGKFLDIMNDNKRYRRYLSEEDNEKIDRISLFVDDTQDAKELAAIRTIRSSFLQDRGSRFRLLTASALKDLFKRPSGSLPSETKIEEMLRNRNKFYHIEDQVIKESVPVVQEEPQEPKNEPESHKALREMRKMIDAVLRDRDDEGVQQREERAHIRTIRTVDTDGVTPENEFDNALWELRGMSKGSSPRVKYEVEKRFKAEKRKQKRKIEGVKADKLRALLTEEVVLEAEIYRYELMEIVFKSLTRYVMEEFESYRRNWLTVSMDIDDPETIKEAARKSFPQTTLITDLFHDAHRMDKNNHIQADVYNTPLLPETVDLFTSIEGWPFYHRNPSKEYSYEDWIKDELGAASHIYTALKPEGEAVFFPWQSSDGNSDHLDSILNLWRHRGAEITIEDIPREQIIDFTKKDENPRLQSHSTIFGNAEQETYKIVRIKKPLRKKEEPKKEKGQILEENRPVSVVA